MGPTSLINIKIRNTKPRKFRKFEEMQFNSIKIQNSYNFALKRCRSGATRGIHWPYTPKSLLVPPNKNCDPPSEDCASKNLTSSMLLESNSRPETPKILVISPEFVSKKRFFVDFAKSHENSLVFWDEDLFFSFGFYPRFHRIPR